MKFTLVFLLPLAWLAAHVSSAPVGESTAEVAATTNAITVVPTSCSIATSSPGVVCELMPDLSSDLIARDEANEAESLVRWWYELVPSSDCWNCVVSQAAAWGIARGELGYDEKMHKWKRHQVPIKLLSKFGSAMANCRRQCASLKTCMDTAGISFWRSEWEWISWIAQPSVAKSANEPQR